MVVYPKIICLSVLSLSLGVSNAGVVKLDDGVRKSLGSGVYVKRLEETTRVKPGTHFEKRTLSKLVSFGGKELKDKCYDVRQMSDLCHYRTDKGEIVARQIPGKEVFRGKGDALYFLYEPVKLLWIREGIDAGIYGRDGKLLLKGEFPEKPVFEGGRAILHRLVQKGEKRIKGNLIESILVDEKFNVLFKAPQTFEGNTSNFEPGISASLLSRVSGVEGVYRYKRLVGENADKAKYGFFVEKTKLNRELDQYIDYCRIGYTLKQGDGEAFYDFSGKLLLSLKQGSISYRKDGNLLLREKVEVKNAKTGKVETRQRTKLYNPKSKRILLDPGSEYNLVRQLEDSAWLVEFADESLGILHKDKKLERKGWLELRLVYGGRGLAGYKVQKKNAQGQKKWAFINLQGKLMTPFAYSNVRQELLENTRILDPSAKVGSKEKSYVIKAEINGARKEYLHSGSFAKLPYDDLDGSEMFSVGGWLVFQVGPNYQVYSVEGEILEGKEWEEVRRVDTEHFVCWDGAKSHIFHIETGKKLGAFDGRLSRVLENYYTFSSGKSGTIATKQGKVIYHGIFSMIWRVANDVIAIRYRDERRNEGVKLIDLQGKLIADFPGSAGEACSDQFFVLKDKQGKSLFVDSKGVKLPQHRMWDKAHSFRDGYAVVQKGGLWGIIDTKGKLVVPCQFEALDHVKGGYTMGFLNGHIIGVSMEGWSKKDDALIAQWQKNPGKASKPSFR